MGLSVELVGGSDGLASMLHPRTEKLSPLPNLFTMEGNPAPTKGPSWRSIGMKSLTRMPLSARSSRLCGFSVTCL